VFVIFYNKIFAVTFDETFSKATGLRPTVYNLIIAVLTALTIVIGMRIMGTLLISALVIFPALTAMRLSKAFKSVIIVAGFFSVICFIVGITMSYYLDIPTGPSVVVVNCGVLVISSIVSKIKHLFRK
jgi:zinc transport system permease protein